MPDYSVQRLPESAYFPQQNFCSTQTSVSLITEFDCISEDISEQCTVTLIKYIAAFWWNIENAVSESSF